MTNVESLWYGFTLLDPKTETLMPNAAITAKDGRITWVGPAAALPAEQLSAGKCLSGLTVMPGLFNCHIHALATPIANPTSLNGEDAAMFALRGLNHLQQHLRSGVTFVRDMNGRKQAEVSLRNAIRQGIVLGPHMQISRQCLCMTGGHGSNTGMECDGPDACRRAAREQIKYGADLIKIMASGGIMSPGMDASAPQLTEEEMRAAIEEAHKAGRKTATHAHSAAAIKCAIRAGIDSVEHGTYLDDECVHMMRDQGVWLVPTLSAIHFLMQHRDDPGAPKEALEKCLRARDAQAEGFRKALEAGVQIAAGTDAGTPFNPHWASWTEVVKLVEFGCTPWRALQAATSDAARLLGVEEWAGSLETGKAADFISLRGNPLEDVGCLAHVEGVWLGGKPVQTDGSSPCMACE